MFDKIKQKLAKNLMRFVQSTGVDQYLFLPTNLNVRTRPLGDKRSSYHNRTVQLDKYRTMSFVFRSVQEIVNCAASVPLAHFKKTEDGSTVELKHSKFLDFMEAPNKSFLWHEFFKKTIAYRILGGTGYWFVEMNNYKEQLEQLLLPRPDKVDVDIKKSGLRKYKDNSQDNGYVPEDVISFRSVNTLSDLEGLSWVLPASDYISVEEYMNKFDKLWYENANLYNYVLLAKEGLDGASLERMKAELSEEQGLENWYQTKIFENVELQEIDTLSHTDSDIDNHTKLIARLIYMHFGCYHLQVMVEQPNRALLDRAEYMFWTHTIAPILDEIEQIIQHKLLYKYFDKDKETIVKFDKRKVSGFKEDLNDESMRDFRYAQLDALTPNQIRDMRDLGDPVDWGDEPYSVQQTGDYAGSRFESNEVRQEGAIKHYLRDILEEEGIL